MTGASLPSCAPRARQRDTPGTLVREPPTGWGRRNLDRAIAHTRAGEYDEAVKRLRRLLEQHPKNAYTLHELALAYRLKGEPRKAVAVLRPHQDALPDLSLAALGSALDEAGAAAHAERVLRDGIRRHPRSGPLHSELGTTLRRGGFVERALHFYERGIQVEPAWPSNYFHAAQIYARSDRLGRALIYGETFTALEPESAQAVEMERLLVTVCGRAADAMRAERTAPTPLTGASFGRPEADDAFYRQLGWALRGTQRDGLTLASLHRARRIVLATPGVRPAEEAPLFQWLRSLNSEGLLEAYDHWLFGPAFSVEFRAWEESHRAELRAYWHYVTEHPLAEHLRQPRRQRPDP